MCAALFATAPAPWLNGQNVAYVPQPAGYAPPQEMPTAAAHAHQHATFRSPLATTGNPLPLGSNTQNKPLLPGTERWDYALTPYAPGQPLVLLAISGGGSRSAYYAARVMEEMAAVPMPDVQNQPLPDGRPLYSLLDTVRGISTVSAGGFASCYYVANFDRRKEPGFFKEMKSALSVNLQWQTYGHMALFPPLAVQLLASSVTRTDLLAEEIDTLILGGHRATFDDLRALETRPIDPAPVLMMNGTVYNSGQRLVMTNLPATRFPSLIGAQTSNIAMPASDRQTLHNLVQPLTFADIGSEIGSYPLSKALAASAAYPILLAPVPLQVYPQQVPRELHNRIDQNLLQSSVAYVADGGLYENEGLDPLLSLLKTLPRSQPVLMIIIDGSERMETMKLNEGEIFGPVRVISRMYDIGNMKSLAYYNKIVEEYHDPSKLEIVVVKMDGYDEKSRSLIKNIPTQFKLSKSHSEALDVVAVQNFAMMYGELMQAYARLQQTRR